MEVVRGTAGARRVARNSNDPRVKTSKKARDVVWSRSLRDDGAVARAQTPLQLPGKAARPAIQLPVSQDNSIIRAGAQKSIDGTVSIERGAGLEEFNQRAWCPRVVVISAIAQSSHHFSRQPHASFLWTEPNDVLQGRSVQTRCVDTSCSTSNGGLGSQYIPAPQRLDISMVCQSTQLRRLALSCLRRGVRCILTC